MPTKQVNSLNTLLLCVLFTSHALYLRVSKAPLQGKSIISTPSAKNSQ